MFRFTIRELVLLTLVVGMGVGWCVDRRRLSQDARIAIEEREKAIFERDEFRTALVELDSAVHREGLSTARLFGGKTHLIDLRGDRLKP